MYETIDIFNNNCMFVFLGILYIIILYFIIMGEVGIQNILYLDRLLVQAKNSLQATLHFGYSMIHSTTSTCNKKLIQTALHLNSI